jgi:hypothetical protein
MYRVVLGRVAEEQLRTKGVWYIYCMRTRNPKRRRGQNRRGQVSQERTAIRRGKVSTVSTASTG